LEVKSQHVYYSWSSNSSYP